MNATELTNLLPDLQPVGWLGLIGSACVVLGYGFKVIKYVVTLLKKTGMFLDDWNGEPARPGVPVRLGILERLSRVEGQLTTNGGQSLKDQTDRIERKLEDHIKATGGTA